LLPLALAVVGCAWFLVRPMIWAKDLSGIVLISIDTCRADHLSCYGYPRKTTPNIDAIAAQSVLFENVISPVPLTLPAHASIFTGTIPPYHGVHNNDYYQLGQSNVTLAEILKDNGFTTASFISAFVMDSRFGLDQGFHTYNDQLEQQDAPRKANERRAEETNRLAFEWLQEHRGEKFFLFLHYFDPHSGYEPPEPFASQFADDLYAGEIAYTDYCIGRLINKLKRLGLYNSTLLIITADHGEMRGEHGEGTHGFLIYQSAIKVPLIIKPAGKTKPQKIDKVVGLIDIFPTICSALGIETPSHVQGQDLSPYFSGENSSAGERYLYCESLLPTRQYNANSLRGVVADRFKYIQTTRDELYDLFEDPAESNNLTRQQKQRARVLSDRLKQILEQADNEGKTDNKLQLDEETRRRLESLGYFASASADEDLEFDRGREDPKDLIAFHATHSAARYHFTRGQFELSKSYCKQMVAQRPDYAMSYLYLGLIAFTEGRIDETISNLKHSLTLDAGQIKTLFTLASIFESRKNWEKAAYYYEKVLQIGPNITALNNLANCLLQIGRYDEAAVHCKKALAIDPNLPQAHYLLGNIYFKKGDAQQAIIQYEKALELKPDFPEARHNLKLAISLKEDP
jgi:arylsulfatase A-like enzyme/Flp pilus assembly protein TadD